MSNNFKNFIEFDNYNIEFPNIAKKEYQNFDKNTVGIFELLTINNYVNSKYNYNSKNKTSSMLALNLELNMLVVKKTARKFRLTLKLI